MLVSLAAWRKGAEVFRNIGSTGKTDLVIDYKGGLYKCDVKSRKKIRGGASYSVRNIASVAPGVYMIAVHPITQQISWHPKTVPPGLENFWD